MDRLTDEIPGIENPAAVFDFHYGNADERNRVFEFLADTGSAVAAMRIFWLDFACWRHVSRMERKIVQGGKHDMVSREAGKSNRSGYDRHLWIFTESHVFILDRHPARFRRVAW